jgi:hypothetical protein
VPPLKFYCKVCDGEISHASLLVVSRL